jgi:hypothetical protein
MPNEQSSDAAKRPLAVSRPADRPNYAVGSDTYSIVLLIARQALSRGDFADVAVEITN